MATGGFVLSGGGLITKSCPTLCDPLDCSPPGSSGPWDFPGKNTGGGCHFFLQEISLIQELNLGLLHCRQIFFFNRLSYEGSPEEAESSKYTHEMVNPGISASSPVGKLRSA